MGIVAKYGHGTFCWIDYAADDADRATAFYTDVMGWTALASPTPEGTYTMLQQKGYDVGGLYAMNEAQRDAGQTPHWLSYVSVDDVEATVARAQELGATVVEEPFDVMTSGRMALLTDPQGVAFALWEPNEHLGARIVNEPNTLCWNELWTHDIDAATAFYTALFGWTAETNEMETGPYTAFMDQGHGRAAVMALPDDAMSPQWTIYFAVDDVDASVQSIEAHGGTRLTDPVTVADVGTFATVTDPDGALFSVIAMERPDAPEYPAESASATA